MFNINGFVFEVIMDNYEIDNATFLRLERNFKYHKPIADQPERYVYIREAAKELAIKIVKNTPPSREQALALTNLEEAIFWANASIARNETEVVEDGVIKEIAEGQK